MAAANFTKRMQTAPPGPLPAVGSPQSRWGENPPQRDARGRGRERRLFLSPSPCLRGCFPIMAAFAKALQVVRVGKQPPVPPMGPDMVYYRGPDPPSLSGALPAPGLPQQLPWPQRISPQGQAVKPMPPGAFPPRPLGPVGRTIALAGQTPAARIPAGPHRFIWRKNHPQNAKRADRPASVMTLVNRLRLSGSGSVRYSQCFPAGIACNRPADCGPWCPAGFSSPGVCTPDTKPIHLYL